MLLMILEKCPASLKGELSRWLIQPKTGVFLGRVSARVRDELWAMAASRAKNGRVMQIWNDRSPQGYSHRCFGKGDREFVDMEGLSLIRLPEKKQRKRKQSESEEG